MLRSVREPLVKTGAVRHNTAHWQQAGAASRSDTGLVKPSRRDAGPETNTASVVVENGGSERG
jgi:hypothetical protein